MALALIDVHMPGMSGLELAELMRGSERTRSVPIIFLTADSAEHARVFRGYEAGAVDFLVKPIDPQLLRSKVGVFVELCRQRMQLAAQVDEHRKLLRMSELLIGVLGHDLRNPLNAIHLAGEALLRVHPDDPTIARLGGRIRSSSKRMARLIAQLLDFATTRQGNCRCSRRTPTCASSRRARSPSSSISRAPDCGTRWSAIRAARGIRTASCSCSRTCSATRSSTARRACRSCCASTDATRTSCTSRSRTAASCPTACAAICSRRSCARTPAGGGAGLGLYIVHHIARAHGGEVAAESGAGRTVFRARLPRHHTAARDTANEVDPQPPR